MLGVCWRGHFCDFLNRFGIWFYSISTKYGTIKIDFWTCDLIIYMTLWSNFLNNRINFILKHKLLPCHQQRLLQVYWKMFTYTTDGIVVENFVLYNILCVIQFVLFYYCSIYSCDVVIFLMLGILFYFISFHSVYSIMAYCYG